MFSLKSEIKDLNKKKGNQFYLQPLEIGRFSLDSNRSFHHDNHQMSYFTAPKAKSPTWKRIELEKPFDLNHGYQTKYIKKDPDKKSNLKTMLNWMLANKSKFYPSVNQKGDFNYIMPPKIVTNRGYITKIMCTNYENNDDWMLVAQKFNGIIYIKDIETEAHLKKRRNADKELLRMQYWGHKFEKYVTVPCTKTDMNKKEMQERVVNTNEAYFSVVSSRFGDDLSIILGAETDCVAKEKEYLGAPACHVELKTSRTIASHQQQKSFFNVKVLKWWAQSYLCGTPTIVCGFRDNKGLVKSLQRYEVNEIPILANKQTKGHAWSPVKCVNFAGNVLSKIVGLMENVNDLNTCCVLTWQLKSNFVDFKIETNSKYAFLPDWYTEEMGK